MVLSRKWFSAVLLAVAGLVFYVVFLAILVTEPSEAQQDDVTGGQTIQQDAGCDNPVLIETFSGTDSQITPDFNITGDTFRLSYEALVINPNEFASFSIDVFDENGVLVDFVPLAFDDVNNNINVLEGPGRFNLEIDADNMDYIVDVEDCVGDGDDGDGITDGNDGRVERSVQVRKPERSEVIINIPRKPLPPTGGLPVYVMVTSSVLAGSGLLGLGIMIHRRPRG